MLTLNELIVFAVVLVILQMVAGLEMSVIAMKVFMSKKIIKKYSQMAMEVAEELTEGM